ncbi:MAG: ribosome assembly RNA-binding protein YhbY [bacterium]|nr:ribosome assembly RNA-binding protein YhbY [bacterium]
MESLSGAQKRKLRAQAHHLKPVIQVGQKGLTESLVEAIDRALIDHELIKVKFGDFKDEKKEIAAEIAKETESALVGLIGNVAILYRESPDEEKQNIVV